MFDLNWFGLPVNLAPFLGSLGCVLFAPGPIEWRKLWFVREIVFTNCQSDIIRPNFTWF